MDCELVRKEIMQEPVGMYSKGVQEHLQFCTECETLYLQIRHLESSFRNQALVKPEAPASRGWVPALVGAGLALFLFFPFSKEEVRILPMKISPLPTDSLASAKIAYEREWREIVEGVVVDPWEEMDFSMDQNISSLLQDSAEQVYELVQESQMEMYSDILESEDPWGIPDYFEG